MWYLTKRKEELHSDSSRCEYKLSIAINTILLIFVFSATCIGSTTIIRHYCTKIYKNSVSIQLPDV
jgi:hypothetical protein